MSLSYDGIEEHILKCRVLHSRIFRLIEILHFFAKISFEIGFGYNRSLELAKRRAALRMQLNWKHQVMQMY
jgi:hypothetical protein